MTLSPPWRPGKRTDYANTQEAKHEHIIYTDREHTEGERGKDNVHTTENGGEAECPGGRICRSKTSRMSHRPPEGETEVLGWLMVQAEQSAWVKIEGEDIHVGH